MPAFDAVLVPGGGLEANGQLPDWVKRRLDRAIERQEGEYIITLSAGTIHKAPLLNKLGFPIFESVAGAEYLRRQGIPREKILTETCSYDTIGNAFFSRVIHAEPGKLSKLLIITSAFHMPRVKEIFTWVYGLDAPAGRFTLEFDKVSDDGIPPEWLASRREKEAADLAHVRSIAKRVHSMQQMHTWLYTEHEVYASHLMPHRITDLGLETY